MAIPRKLFMAVLFLTLVLGGSVYTKGFTDLPFLSPKGASPEELESAKQVAQDFINTQLMQGQGTAEIASIVEETGGKDYTKKGTLVPRNQCYVEALRSMLGLHAFLASGAFTSAFGGMDSIAVCIKMAELNIPVKKEYIEKKTLANDGGEGIWMQTYEYGHYAHADPRSFQIQC